MILNCFLNSLRFNADVSLCGGCAAMLKEPLHQCYVKSVGIVDFGCIPLAETVSADTLTSRHYRKLCISSIVAGLIFPSSFSFFSSSLSKGL